MANVIIGPTGAGALPNSTATLDPINDLLPFFQSSTTATKSINRNVFLGITGSPVGTSDTQTLPNKTLTAPNIGSPVLSGTVSGVYTLGGTPTISSPTISSPTISSPTITGTLTAATATLSGLLTANGGLTVPTGQQTTLASILLNGAITGTGLAGQVQSQTNTGTAGGTFYYINLGGIKLFWGQTAQLSQATSTENGYSINLPASFFNSIQYVGITPYSPSGTSYFVMNAYASTNTSIGVGMTNQTGVTLTFSVYVLVIGT